MWAQMDSVVDAPLTPNKQTKIGVILETKTTHLGVRNWAIELKLCTLVDDYYGFQTVCKCPFRALLVTRATDFNQTSAN